MRAQVRIWSGVALSAVMVAAMLLLSANWLSGPHPADQAAFV